ncbi:asparaginase [Rhodobacteraceae bacterium NNCM2]|nr:asparaginase [Coraliihabitans acroporae]
MMKASRPHIKIVATGGTIASLGSDPLDFHNYRVESCVEELLAAIPDMGSIAELSCIQPVNIDSFRVDNPNLIAIGRAVESVAQDPTIDGIVVTHGTDTLEETAYFLHLVLKTTKPVVMVGAMRPATALSADGPLNLYNAILVAACEASAAAGVLVVANNHVFGARDVSKRDTSAIDAIGGSKYGILGEICGTVIDFAHRPVKRHTIDSEFYLDPSVELPQVDVMLDHPSAAPHLYEASIAAGSKAIVVAGMGNGSLSAGSRQGAMLALSAGVSFIRASRTGQGMVAPLRSDSEFAVIAGSSLPAQKARILAMLAIAHGKRGAELQTIFDQY